MVITAGSIGILSGNNQTPSPAETSSQKTITSESASEHSNRTPLPTDTNIGEVVLKLPDTGFGYNFTSESIQYVSNASAETKQRLLEKGIQKQHTRVFTLTSSDKEEKPILIRSTAVIYDNVESTENDLQNALNTFNSQGANTTRIQIASGITATQVQIKDNSGRYNVILYGKEENLLYYIIVTGEQRYYEERAKELFLEMVVDVK